MTPSEMWKRRQTVRPRSSVNIPVLLCALIFAVTAVVVSRIGRERWVPARPTFTATAFVVEKGANARTPFTSTDSDRWNATEMANAQADQFAADSLAQWRCGTEGQFGKVHDAAEKARREHNENVTQLKALERQRQKIAQTKASASRQEKPKPAMIENPRWRELRQQISEVEQRRDQLLQDRTPLHPAVREVEDQLAGLQKQLATIPQQIAGKQPQTTDVSSVTPSTESPATKEILRKIEELTAMVEKSRLARETAEQAEQQALQEQPKAPQYVVQYAQTAQSPTQIDYGWRRLIWTTLAASMLMAFGVGSIALGASIEPPVASVEEVESDLGESILGTIPSDDPVIDVATIRNQSRVRRVVMTIGVVLIVACPIVAIWGTMGI